MDKLQRQFDGEIQILPYAEEKLEKVEDIFARIKKQMDLILPSASETSIPKVINSNKKIWIYKGKLIAKTGTLEVNAENIEAVLNGGEIKYKGLRNKKKKEFEHLNDFNGLQLNHSVLRKNIGEKFQSALSKGMKGYDVDSKYKMPKEDDKVYGRRYINFTISLLYIRAYDLPSISEWVIEVADKKHFYPGYGMENASNTYCYEIMASNDENMGFRDIHKEANKIMQKDLEKVFNITVKKEKRNIKVYVLRKMKGYEKLISKGGEKKMEATAFFINYQNMPFSALVKKIEYCLETGFLIDETGLDINVDLDINVRTYDYKEMKQALKEYGLELTIEEREREVFVIKEI